MIMLTYVINNRKYLSNIENRYYQYQKALCLTIRKLKLISEA